MVTPVHITKRALAVVGGRDEDAFPEDERACDGLHTTKHNDFVVGEVLARKLGESCPKHVTCPRCLVLLDAELEGRGAEAQRQVAEIEREVKL